MNATATNKIQEILLGTSIELGMDGYETQEFNGGCYVWKSTQAGTTKNKEGFEYMVEGITIVTTDSETVITKYENHALNAGQIKINHLS